MSVPFDSPFDGPEYDEAILKVRNTILVGLHKAADGNVNGPSFAFTNEVSSGLYCRGAGDIRLSVLGHDKTQWTVSNIQHYKPLLIVDGFSGGCGIAFANNPTSGMYRNAANDIRLAVNGSDFLVMNFVTASGATNAPSLGIGTPPLRGGLHIRCPNSASTGTGIQLENTDPTDGNATGFSCRVNTTGVGGAVMAEIGKFNLRCDIHDNTTRTSHMDFNWVDNGVSMFIQFIAIAGVRGLRSDSGALTVQATGGTLTLQTGGSNANILLTPNGTGKIVLDVAKPLQISSGTNQRAGDAILVGGTVTIANTTVSANTKVIVSRKVAGGTLGFLTYTLSAGVSFTITSSSATETSTVTYWLIEVV
jgi:hypothetical protein